MPKTRVPRAAWHACAAALALLLAAPALAGPPTVEVLHWMTSGGQAKAMKSLKDDLEAQGGRWIDTPVGGGASDDALTKLRARVIAGDAPSSVQLKGPLIQEWGALKVLQPIDEVAAAGQWEKALPRSVAEVMKYQGRWVAAPVNVHRLDWMYANPAVLQKVGITMPTTWEQFDAAAVKLKAAGITPLAHGGQARIAVHVYPFRMTAANLEKHKAEAWATFWQGLKPAYDRFETDRTPPRISVCKSEYHVEGASAGYDGSMPVARTCDPAAAQTTVAAEATPADAKTSAGMGPLRAYLEEVRKVTPIALYPGATKPSKSGKRSVVAGVPVRCNLRLPSCRKWAALHRRAKPKATRTASA